MQNCRQLSEETKQIKQKVYHTKYIYILEWYTQHKCVPMKRIILCRLLNNRQTLCKWYEMCEEWNEYYLENFHQHFFFCLLLDWEFSPLYVASKSISYMYNMCDRMWTIECDTI